MKRYEICTYKFGIDAQGNHSHIDSVTDPVKTGWNIYVRDYADGEEDLWEEVYDKDFATESARNSALRKLEVKYPDATVDSY
jgi:hypothetical protein